MSAFDEIAAERKRQIEAEGWTDIHDDQHTFGELANAAACYAMTNSSRALIVSPYTMDSVLHRVWPFSREWWKPKARRRDLIRAAALIVAEIERLDRVNATDITKESKP